MLTLARRVGRLIPLGMTLAAVGCYEADHHHCDPYYDQCGDYPGNPQPPGAVPVCTSGVAKATIDMGAYLQLDSGYVGVSAEYFGAGAWRFAMACDTAQPTSG